MIQDAPSSDVPQSIESCRNVNTENPSDPLPRFWFFLFLSFQFFCLLSFLGVGWLFVISGLVDLHRVVEMVTSNASNQGYAVTLIVMTVTFRCALGPIIWVTAYNLASCRHRNEVTDTASRAEGRILKLVNFFGDHIKKQPSQEKKSDTNTH